MSLIRFLLCNSWHLAALSAVAGLLNSVAGVAIIAIVHAAMSVDRAGGGLAWGFLGVSVLFVLSRAATQILLVRLGQDSIANLRTQLSQRILDAPLRHVEELGSHRLLAALNDDVAVIAQASVQLSMLCVNGATVTGDVVATAGDAFLDWQFPLHNGEALGLPGRIVVFVVGFVPLILYLTGLKLWLTRRRAKKLSRERRRRSDQNGSRLGGLQHVAVSGAEDGPQWHGRGSARGAGSARI